MLDSINYNHTGEHELTFKTIKYLNQLVRLNKQASNLDSLS